MESLISQGVLRSPMVIRAMRTVSREQFLPEDMKSRAYFDTPLPIGFGQTISAPHMVAIMAEALELDVGLKVLEVGTGSGYHAAVTAEIVAPNNRSEQGLIYTIEIVPNLASIAKINLERANYRDRVKVISGDGSIGYPVEAPYDRILVTASAPQIPLRLIEQLKIGGLLVIPIGGLYFFQRLLKVTRNSDTEVTTADLGGVAFVPLKGKNGWSNSHD